MYLNKSPFKKNSMSQLRSNVRNVVAFDSESPSTLLATKKRKRDTPVMKNDATMMKRDATITKKDATVMKRDATAMKNRQAARKSAPKHSSDQCKFAASLSFGGFISAKTAASAASSARDAVATNVAAAAAVTVDAALDAARRKTTNNAQNARQQKGVTSRRKDAKYDEDEDEDEDDKRPCKQRKTLGTPVVAAPSPGTKHYCKRDLKRTLRVGEIVEVTRVDQHYLDAHNNGERIQSRFTGEDFYDLHTNMTYRSVSEWVKKRMVDVGALGHKSNISGYDYCAVERDGRKQALRMIVDSDDWASSPETRNAVPQQTQNTFATSNTNVFSIADRMAELCRPPSDASSNDSKSSSPGTTEFSAVEENDQQQHRGMTKNQLLEMRELLRVELERAKTVTNDLTLRLAKCENELRRVV